MTEANSTELALPDASITDPEAMQRVSEALSQLADALREVVKAVVEALKPIIDAVVSVARKFWRAIAAGIVPGKWLHLAEHAKKARTRKKWRNRIRKAVLEALREAAT